MSRKKENAELIDRMEGERENVEERKIITQDYYSSRPKTFETMLGGYTQVHDPDIQESNQLIQSLFKQMKINSSHCLELGCGIGRVTKHLLSRYFDRIDINDLLEDYCQQTRTLFEDDSDKIDRAFPCSIRDIQLDHFPKYDLIWAQWVLGYLDGDDLVLLLRKLKSTLKKNGFIVIKDNCVANGQDAEFDPDDQYYVRTGEQFYDIAHRAGFTIVKDLRSKLKQIVRELLPIRIFVLTMDQIPIRSNIHLSLSNISKEIYQLISTIRPDWNSSNTRLETFTEGITNSIFGLFDNRMNGNDSNGLVIKLFGANTDLFIDRQSEFDAMVKLSKDGVLSQKILIQFANGVIYEYASGKACSRENVRQDQIAKLIAIKLAQFHSVQIEKGENPYVIPLIRQFIQIINQNEQQRKEISSLVSDVDVIEERILPKLVPNPKIGRDLVLCHNDLLVKNIIYNEKTNEISFIDFEYTHLNYYLFDIANHFVEYAGVDNADFNLYPTRDEQKRWLKIYFQTRQMDETIINDDFCHLIDQFSALPHLLWGLWALVQSRLSQLDFDYVHYAKQRLDCYQKLRPLLFQSIEN